MKLDRIKNAKRGLVFGLINTFVGLLMPFFIQTITIRQLGIEYIGMKGLFTSILTVFSLVELGFGSAIVYSMYKPIAEDDFDILCALLNLYRKVYRIIGLIILFLGLAITPFIRFLINGSYPSEISLEYVFLLYLANTVLSYLVFGYKSSLLYAYQRMDIYGIVGTSTVLFMSGIQIIVLLVFKNFYLFLIASIIATLINNITISIVTDRLFPKIRCIGQVTKEVFAGVKKHVTGMLISKVCATSRNTFDSIFLSAFLGLEQAAIYSNYYYIITALNGVTIVFLNALVGGVGNSIAMELKEKNFRDMIVLNNIYTTIGGMMSICMLCLYQPFMSLWMGDKYLFPTPLMMMFPLYFYILKMGDIRGVYSDAAGLFWENRWRCFAETIANILLNFILGMFFGAAGILIATIITLLFIGFTGSTIVIFKCYFTTGLKEYLKKQAIIFLCTLLIGVLTYYICTIINYDDNRFCLLYRCLICLFFIPSMYWIILHRTADYKNAKAVLIKAYKEPIRT